MGEHSINITNEQSPNKNTHTNTERNSMACFGYGIGYSHMCFVVELQLQNNRKLTNIVQITMVYLGY